MGLVELQRIVIKFQVCDFTAFELAQHHDCFYGLRCSAACHQQADLNPQRRLDHVPWEKEWVFNKFRVRGGVSLRVG